jgi:hypothetical protein
MIFKAELAREISRSAKEKLSDELSAISDEMLHGLLNRVKDSALLGYYVAMYDFHSSEGYLALIREDQIKVLKDLSSNISFLGYRTDPFSTHSGGINIYWE